MLFTKDKLFSKEEAVAYTLYSCNKSLIKTTDVTMRTTSFPIHFSADPVCFPEDFSFLFNKTTFC